MKNIYLTIIVLLANTLIYALPWECIESEHFRIYYNKKMAVEAEHLIKKMEYYKPYVESITGYSPKKANLVIAENGNTINGFCSPINNKIQICNFPGNNDRLNSMDDLYSLVSIHEYTHLSQMRQATGINKALVNIFGDFFYPMYTIPGWMTEGITVFAESNYSPKSGRLNGEDFYGIVHTQALQNNLPDHVQAGFFNENTNPNANYYTYGGAFYNFLNKKYGKAKIAEFYQTNTGTLRSLFTTISSSYGLDRSAEQVFGKSFPDLWYEWMFYEKENTRLNLVPDQAELNCSAGSMSNLVYHDGKIYMQATCYTTFDPYRNRSYNQIRVFDTKTNQSKNIYLHPATFTGKMFYYQDHLYFASLQYKSGMNNKTDYGYGLVNELYCLDLKTGEAKSLLVDDFNGFSVSVTGKIYIMNATDHFLGTDISIFDPVSKKKTALFNTDLAVFNIFEYQDKYLLNARKNHYLTSKDSTSLCLNDSLQINPSIYLYNPVNKESKLLSNPIFDEQIRMVKNDTLVFTANYDNYLKTYAMNLANNKTSCLSDLYFMNESVLDDSNNLYSINFKNNIHNLVKTSPSAQTVDIKAIPVKHFEPKINTKEITVKSVSPYRQFYQALTPSILHMPFYSSLDDSINYGIYLIGADKLGYIPQWSARISASNKTSKIDHSVSLTLLPINPLSFNLESNTIEDDYFSSTISAPLYLNTSHNPNMIYLSLTHQIFDEYQRKLLNPNLSMTYNKNYLNIISNYGIKYEDINVLTSDRKRIGYYSKQKLSYTQNYKVNFSSNLHFAYDPDADLDEVFENIRFYKDEPLSNKGFSISNDIQTSLFNLDSGTWDVNCYLKKATIGAFFDVICYTNTTLNKSYLNQYSYGLSLKLGTVFFLEFPLVFDVSAGLDKNHESHIQLGFVVPE